MSKNSRSMSADPSTACDIVEDSERLLTKDADGGKVGKHQSSTIPHPRRNGNRIGVNQRMRIMQQYVVGKTQTAIAQEEGVDRESVRRIVRSPELTAYVEEKRELWRGLCDPAIEVIRQKLKEGDGGCGATDFGEQ
jgi:hypothetical protein